MPDSAAPEDELVDAEQAARLAGVTVSRIDVLVAEGLLTPIDTGPSGPRFRHAEVVALREIGG